MLGHVWEFGCTLRRLADDQEIRSGESSGGEPLQTYPSGGTRTERELNYQLTKDRLYVLAHRLHAAGGKRIQAEEELRKAQVRVGELEALASRLSGENVALSEKVSALSTENSVLKDGAAVTETTMAALTSSLAEAREANQRLQSEATEREDKVITDFLVSQVFRMSTVLSAEDMMRACLYRELTSLGQVYPFTPEMLGYTFPEGGAQPKALAGY